MYEINAEKGTRDAVTPQLCVALSESNVVQGASVELPTPHTGRAPPTLRSYLLQRPPCNSGQPPLFPVPIRPPRRGREQYKPVAVVHARHDLDERELRDERQGPVAHLQRELPYGKREPRGAVEHVLGYDPAIRVPQREATEHPREHGRAAGHEQDVGDVEGHQARCVRRDERDCGRDGAGKDVAGVDVQVTQPRQVRSGWVARGRVKRDDDARRVEAQSQVCQVVHGRVCDAFEDAADACGADDDGQGTEGRRSEEQDLREQVG